MTGFDPSRIEEAVQLIDAKRLTPIVRRAADDFYAEVMHAMEDYLRDNIEYNLKAHLAMVETENATLRRELYEVDQIVSPPGSTPESRVARLRVMDKAMVNLVMAREALRPFAAWAEYCTEGYYADLHADDIMWSAIRTADGATVKITVGDLSRAASAIGTGTASPHTSPPSSPQAG